MFADYKATALADSAKALWLLDLPELGPPGSLPADSTGHGYDITGQSGAGAATYYTRSFLHAETAGVSFQVPSEFDGPVVPTAGSWTAEVWVLTSSLPTSGGVAIFYNGHYTGASGGDGYGISQTAGGVYQVIANGFNDHFSWGSTGASGALDHFAIGYDSSGHGGYVWQNGVPGANPYTWTNVPLAPTTALRIGTTSGSTAANITVFALAIFDHLLDDAHVLAHYNAMVGMASADADYPYLSFVHSGAGAQQPASGRISLL